MVWILIAACAMDAVVSPKETDVGHDSGDTASVVDTAESGETGESSETGEPECPPMVVGVAGSVPTIATCALGQTVSPVTDPWDSEVAWTWDGSTPTEWGVNSGPVVAVTDDTDGDGVLTMDDVPAILVVTTDYTSRLSALVALDGATGRERWRWTDVAGYSQPAIADLDGDGVPEVLTWEWDNSLIAIEPPGTLFWRSSVPTGAYYAQGVINVADLEGDGTVEVIADATVIEGATGVVRFEVPVDHDAQQLGGTSVADLDGDGAQELVCYGSIYDALGAKRWTTGDKNYHGNWGVPVQADEDPEPELVMIGMEYGLYEGDGTELFRGPYQRNAYAGAPCAGDFDGDGEVEVAFGSAFNFLLMSLDGTIEWETPIDDTSCCGGCSGFDLDGDGGLEILYNDHYTSYVFDAVSGTTLMTFPRKSGTTYEYPVAVDVDLDGASEILLTSDWDDAYPGISVLKHTGSGWPSLGSTWPIHDYAVSNIGIDASVPPHPDPYWSEHRVYRARVPVTTPLVDAFVTFTDGCQLDCTDGPAEVALQVGNQGLVDLPEGATLTLYAVSDGAAREIDRWTLPAIPSGTTLDGVDRVLAPGEIGTDGYRATLTMPDGVTQCDEINDVAEWADVPC